MKPSRTVPTALQRSQAVFPAKVTEDSYESAVYLNTPSMWIDKGMKLMLTCILRYRLKGNSPIGRPERAPDKADAKQLDFGSKTQKFSRSLSFNIRGDVSDVDLSNSYSRRWLALCRSLPKE